MKWFSMGFIDPASLSCTIDGVAVENVAQYRAGPKAYRFGPLPPDNMFQLWGFEDAKPGTKSLSVADGYYILLRPLVPGIHTIHFYGEGDYTSVGGPLFILDISYTITVESDDD